MNHSRRQYLQTLALTTTIGLTGCLGGGNGDERDEPTEGNEGRDSPTPTEQQDTPTPQQTQTPQEETETPTPEPEPTISKVDFRAWENQEKRQELREVTPETWLDNHFIDTASSPIVQNFSSGDNDRKLDLTALQLHHHDSYTEWDWVEKAIEAIDNPETLNPQNTDDAPAEYPDGEKFMKNVEVEKMEEVETYEKFHMWAFAYLSNFEWQMRGKLPFSGRDQAYAALLQETVNRYAQNFDAHVWSYDTEFGRHGFMSVYSKSNDQVKIDRENLKALDTVKDAPVEDGEGWHEPKLIEKSLYTDSDNNYWHPVQFADGEYGGQEFWFAKKEATRMFGNIGGNESRNRSGLFDEANFALTTGFLEDVMEGLGTYNLEENSYDFETDIRNNALTVEKLRRTDGEFIVDEVNYADDQIVLETYDVSNYENSNQLLENVWNDESGTYDNFGEIPSEFEQGDHQTLEQAAQKLEAAA